MKYKFDEEQYELCKNYVKKCCEHECYRENIKHDIIYDDINKTVTVAEDDAREFMSAADETIIVYGMVNQDYLTDLGCKLQFLYDEIYYQTKNQ